LEGLSLGKTLPVGQGICSRVMQDGRPLLIHDAAEDPRGVQYSPAARSILCVPLAWGQRNIGVLSAFSAQRDAFSNHDRRLLRTMAGSLAITIENVRLLNALKRSEKALTLRNYALERANVRLQELDRIKSVFVASVSHELRTPLNAIIGFSEVLIDGLAGNLPALAQEYLSYVHKSGKHLLDLINDILDLSKIQAGRMTLTLEQVDVLEVLNDVQATMALLVRKKDQTLRIKAADPLPCIVADRSRLKQIFLNLIGNANKFTPRGGQITVCALMPDPDTMQVDVIDNGPGIALENQVLIFEEFRQASKNRALGEGTGLGLAITRRLVELHGGRIWVESEPGAGATFTVLLPLDGPKSVEAGSEEIDARELDFATGSRRDAIV
jgi:signal transduction histidine kinase